MTDFGASSYHRDPAADPQSFQTAVHTYADALVRYAYSILGSSAAAEDAMEEAFALLYVKKPRFTAPEQLRAWLYKTVHRQALDQLRRNRRMVPLEDVEQVLAVGDMEGDYIRAQRDRTLYLCLQRIPRDYRQVLQLRYYDDFSAAQIAAITGDSLKQVYNRLNRGRIALKNELQKEGISHEDL